MSPRLLASAIAAVAILSDGLGSAAGQATESVHANPGEVVATRLVPPTYPPIAASARVSGEVEVRVGVGPDGRVESAVIVRSVPLLDAAALDAARKSEFQCSACAAPVTPYTLVYAFRLDAPNQSAADTPQAEQTGPAQSRVSVVAPLQPLYILFSSTRIRSAKCLFLWSCSTRWGGLDFYCVRVRSPRCLWLWRCADSCPASTRE
jgi:TonB family protein